MSACCVGVVSSRPVSTRSVALPGTAGHELIHGKFSMTISLLDRRHRDAEGLILYRCFFFLSSFFFDA